MPTTTSTTSTTSTTGFDFPLTVYDRPSLAAANIARGDFSASVRSLFAPQTLTPTELRKLSNMYSEGGKKPNLLFKTIIDLTTNPLVIIGLMMALGPMGKVANLKNLVALRQSLGKEIAPVLPFIRGLVSPQTGFRNAPKVLDNMNKIVKASSDMHAKMLDDYAEWLRTLKENLGRKLTKRDSRMIYAHLGGLHTTENPMIKFWGKRHPKGGLPFLDPNTPLLPKLEAGMVAEGGPNNALMKAAKSMRGLMDKYGKKILLDDKTGEIADDLAAKGVEYIDINYAPQLVQRTPLGVWGLHDVRVSADQTLRNLYRTMTRYGGKAQSAKARKGFSLPMMEDIDMLRDLADPGQLSRFREIRTVVVDRLRQSLGRFMREAAWTPEELWTEMKLSSAHLADQLEELGKLPGWKKNFLTRVSSIMTTAIKKDPEKLEEIIDALASTLGKPARYTMDITKVFPEYARHMAPTYGWFSTGLGKATELLATKSLLPDQLLMWQDDIRPMLRGMKPFREYARNLKFKDTLVSMQHWLLEERGITKHIPRATRDKLITMLSPTTGGLTERSIGGELSSLFYASTLGLNISPVSKNLLQNYITTLNVVGPGNMTKGLGRVVSGTKVFFGNIQRLGYDDAFKLAFPEYSKAMGSEGIAQAMAAGDIALEGAHPGLMGTVAGKVKQTILAPFAVSEKFNRLLAYYSGEAAGKASGLGGAALEEVATNITKITQFTGGVMGQPAATRGMWSPFRQFMHFPLRFMEFLIASLRFGPDVEKLSLGVLGRTMVGSAGLYTVAKNLAGIDISGGLLFSALPYPQFESSPFYPFPLVPPIVGVAGDLAKATLTGEWRGVPGRTAAMLAPAGLAIRRGLRTFRPKYADYANRGPDGRIPIYNDKGALIGTQSVGQLVMRGLGIKPSALVGEQEAMGYLLKQRDKIRQYRRDYLEALSDNELGRAEAINNDFQRQYPELGRITVKKSDLHAIKNRKEISRLHRTLQGFSKEHRGLFEQVLNTAAMMQVSRDVAYDPSSIRQYLGMSI